MRLYSFSTVGLLALSALQATFKVNATTLKAKSSIRHLLNTGRGVSNAGSVHIGGIGGDFHEDYACNNGEFIEKIEVWAGYDKIRAIRMTFPGDKVLQRGRMEERYHSFSFERGEYLTSLSIWGNGIGTRTGYIKFKTNLGNVFDFGMKKGLGREYVFNVHSGYICGMFGYSGWDINSFGIFFLPKVASANLHSVEYPNLNRAFTTKKTIILGQIDHDNISNVAQTIQVSEVRTVTETTHWKLGASITAAAEIKAKARVPIVGKWFEVGTEVTAKLQLSGNAEYQSVHTKTETTTFGFPVVIPPHSRMVADITVDQDVIDVNFEGILTLHFVNGESFDFHARGKFNSVTGRRVTAKVKPQGTNVGLPHSLRWRKCSTDAIPDGIYPYGIEKTGACLFVGRAKHGDCYIIGKAAPQLGGCAYNFDGVAYLATNYDVLDVDAAKVTWVPVRGAIPEDGNICPEGYVKLYGGANVDGKPLYVARIKDGGEVIPGSAGHPPGIIMRYVHEGKPRRSDDFEYELMCVKANFKVQVV